jgi:hypothetical protein
MASEAAAPALGFVRLSLRGAERRSNLDPTTLLPIEIASLRSQ